MRIEGLTSHCEKQGVRHTKLYINGDGITRCKYCDGVYDWDELLEAEEPQGGIDEGQQT